MKKIAVFSDIHANLQALQSIFEDIDNDKFDEVIYLGDMVGIGPNPKECVDMFMDSKIKVVKGNHEIYQAVLDQTFNKQTTDEIKHRDWIHSELDANELNYLEKLPMSIDLLIDGKLFTFSHFFLNEKKDYFESLNILGTDKEYEVINKQESDYLFIGHSHDNFQVYNGSLFTCVGSSGCRKNNSTFYTIVEIDNGIVKMHKKEIAYDRKSLEKEINKKNYPDRDKIAEIFFGVKVNKD